MEELEIFQSFVASIAFIFCYPIILEHFKVLSLDKIALKDFELLCILNFF